MRVFVTGVAGFIGSNLAEHLIERGYEVEGCDNFDPYYDTNRKRANITSIAHVVHELDILDGPGLRSCLSEFSPDVVVHLAAKAGVRSSIDASLDYCKTNILGTNSLLDSLLSLSRVPRLVFGSTSSVYGSSKAVPFVESDRSGSTQSPYALTKLTAEGLCRQYHEHFGVSTTILRFFTVYGPRGRPDMMPFKLARSCLEGNEVPLYDGPLARDWTYVSDICRGVEGAIRLGSDFGVYNLGRGNSVRLDSFIRLLAEVAGAWPNLIPTSRPGTEMMVTWADSTASRLDLEYQPCVDVEHGVPAFWSWFEQEYGS